MMIYVCDMVARKHYEFQNVIDMRDGLKSDFDKTVHDRIDLLAYEYAIGAPTHELEAYLGIEIEEG